MPTHYRRGRFSGRRYKLRRPLPKRPRRKARRVVGSRLTNTRQIGFPKFMTLRMRYVESLTSNSVLGALTTTPFGMNCLYDPFLGVGGHQPMGFDQAMIYYQYATVMSSKVTVTAASTDSQVNVPIKFGLFITADSSFNYTNWGEIQESGAQVRTIIPLSNRPPRASAYFSGMKKLVGQTPYELAETTNSVASNPPRIAYCHLWVQTQDVATTSDLILFNLQIDYNVRLFNMNQIPAS